MIAVAEEVRAPARAQQRRRPCATCQRAARARPHAAPGSTRKAKARGRRRRAARTSNLVELLEVRVLHGGEVPQRDRRRHCVSRAHSAATLKLAAGDGVTLRDDANAEHGADEGDDQSHRHHEEAREAPLLLVRRRRALDHAAAEVDEVAGGDGAGVLSVGRGDAREDVVIRLASLLHVRLDARERDAVARALIVHRDAQRGHHAAQAASKTPAE